jgi:hypothetical protein
MSAAVRETSTRYDRPHRPLPVAWVNRALAAAGRRPPLHADLSPDALLAAARRRAKLDDLGDPRLPDRLALLVDSIEREADLHPLGRWMARENLVGILANRLRMTDDLRRHPEIDAVPLAPPIVIVGLQRTGTTVLHRLLASDPARRFLPAWEAVNPAPFGPERDGPDPRLRAAALAERVVRYLAPDFFAIHPIEALAPEEDCLLFNFDLRSTVFEATMRVPTYSRRLESEDPLPAYRAYARVLRYLQRQRPGGPWVLKTPQHMESLDALLAVFPEATVVQTHRDPERVLASFCSMMAHSRGVFSDRVDPRDVGRHWFRKARRMVARAAETRARFSERFIDVRYADLLADPIGEVRRVCAFAGTSLSAEAEARMRAWLAANPQHKHGRHRYRLEDFGLERAEVSAAFAEYRRRLRIPEE